MNFITTPEGTRINTDFIHSYRKLTADERNEHNRNKTYSTVIHLSDNYEDCHWTSLTVAELDKLLLALGHTLV